MSTKDEDDEEFEKIFGEKRDIYQFINPFSFEGWEGEDVVGAKPDFAESHAIAHSKKLLS